MAQGFENFAFVRSPTSINDYKELHSLENNLGNSSVIQDQEDLVEYELRATVVKHGIFMAILKTAPHLHNALFRGAIHLGRDQARIRSAKDSRGYS